MLDGNSAEPPCWAWRPAYSSWCKRVGICFVIFLMPILRELLCISRCLFPIKWGKNLGFEKAGKADRDAGNGNEKQATEKHHQKHRTTVICLNWFVVILHLLSKHIECVVLF